jgi:tetratricopeptide (TPR) repeat protein
MRKIFLLLLPAIFIMNVLSAQTSRLQQGMENFMNGSYVKALEYLTQAISQDRALDNEMLAEAYYYRGLTYVRLHNEAYTGDNKKEQEIYKDAYLSAYKDYKASLGYDGGTLWKQIDLEIKNLHHPLLQEGLKSLNEYNELVYQGKPDAKLLQRAEDFLLSAHEIRETYLVCDLLGQVYLDKGNKQEAAAYFSKSEKLYTEKLPAEPDFLMAYVFYRLAALHKSEDVRLALQDNQRGIKFMESEHERFLMTREKISPERVAQMEEQSQLGLKDLNNLKLDLYLSNDELYVEAIHVFEEEMARKPEDVNMLIGYASLLEKTDKEKAIQVYQQALNNDPNNSIALFNTGALLYTKGKNLFDTAQKTTDNDQYKILSDEADKNFRLSMSFFERALAEDPESLETIQALRTIAFILDDQDAYLKYQEMESRMDK